MDVAAGGVILGFLALLIPIVAILAPIILVLGIVWICRGGSYRCDRTRQAQEIELMQQIHAGLTKLGGRVEALETILIDTRENAAAGRER